MHHLMPIESWEKEMVDDEIDDDPPDLSLAWLCVWVLVGAVMWIGFFHMVLP